MSFSPVKQEIGNRVLGCRFRQLQRVAIARSLVANPSMILLDEPFGALDGFTRAKMQFFLLDLFQKSEVADLNPTVVLVTHDPREAVLLGNDIYIMDAGVLNKWLGR